MTKTKDDKKITLSLSALLYCSVSVLLLSLEFLITSFFIRVAFNIFKNNSSLQLIYKVKFIFYDYMGFALMTILNSIIQYYLGALLAVNIKNKKHRYIIIAASTFTASLFFIKYASKTGFNSHLLAVIPLIISYFLGGVIGINEDIKKNPWKRTKYHFLK